MAENQLSKSSNAPFVVPHDVFDAMRREMNKIFGTLDLRPQEWPRCSPALKDAPSHPSSTFAKPAKPLSSRPNFLVSMTRTFQ